MIKKQAAHFFKIDKKKEKKLQNPRKQSKTKRQKDGIIMTSLLLLSGSTTSLQNFKLDKAQRHQAQCETRHDPSEEHQQARHPGVHEPPGRPERNVIGLEYDAVYCPTEP